MDKPQTPAALPPSPESLSGLLESALRLGPSEHPDDRSTAATDIVGPADDDLPLGAEAASEARPSLLRPELSLIAEGFTVSFAAGLQLRKTLVLLDFNGTLVLKDSQWDNKVRGRRPDFVVPTGKSHSNAFFLRPFARELVCHLLNDPRCDVPIYTSMMAKNVKPVVEAFDRHFEILSRRGEFEPVKVGASVIDSHSSLWHGKIALYDQAFNTPDETGENEWDTKRDLGKIWASPVAESKGYTAKNTVMVEGEPRKVREWKSNSLLLREYQDVTSEERDRPPVLQSLLECLEEKVFAKMQRPEVDIRDLLGDGAFRIGR